MLTRFKYVAVMAMVVFTAACPASREKAKADSQVRLEMAREYLSAGDAKKALAEAETALKIYPDNFDATLAKAEILAKSGKFDDAFKTVDETSAKLPKEELFRKDYWAGVVYYHKGELEKAKHSFILSSGLNPKFAGNYSLLGQVYTKTGAIGDAAATYAKWTQIEPNNSNAWDQLGITYVWARKFDKAKEALDKAILINPKNAMAYNYLGTWSEEQNKGAEAEQFFAKSISMDAKNPYAQLNMAQLLMLQKRWGDALPFLKKTLEIQKDNIYALFWLGKYHHEMKEYGNAADMFERAVAADPSFWAARMGLAEAALADPSLSARAEKSLGEGVALDARNEKGHYYYLARLKLASKDAASALRYAEKASAMLEPGDVMALADSHLLRGMILDAMKKGLEAKTEYRTAIKLAPKSSVAAEAEKRLKR